MTKDEAIMAMRCGEKVSHLLFTDDEFVTMKDDGMYDERGCWIDTDDFWKFHNTKAFSVGWIIYKPKQLAMSKIKNDRPLMTCNKEPDVCPSCGALEVPSNTPATTYGCGSYDYDGRPGTFHASEKCRQLRNQQKQ